MSWPPKCKDKKEMGDQVDQEPHYLTNLEVLQVVKDRQKLRESQRPVFEARSWKKDVDIQDGGVRVMWDQGDGKPLTEDIWILQRVEEYLEAMNGHQDTEKIRKYVDQVNAQFADMGLFPCELLQLVNICPGSTLALEPIIESLSERLGQDETTNATLAEDFVQMLQETFGPRK